MRIVAAGGGTGGHLFPLLSILEEMEKRVDLEVLFFAVEGKIDERIVKREHPSYKLVSLNVRGLERPILNLKNLSRIFKYARAFLKVKKHLKDFKPDAAIFTGGYVSAVVGFTFSRKVPIFVHEQNAVPGIANLFLSKKARKVFVSFDETLGYFKNANVIVSGNPVREIFYTKRKIDIPDGIILVLGGSLGSELINSVMEKVYESVKDEIFVHSTGSAPWTERLSRFENVIAFDFVDFMPLVWRKAKMVIARSGATTIGEMIRYGVGGVLIPWKGSAGRHQIENALALKKLMRVKIVDEGDLKAKTVIEALGDWRQEGRGNPVKIIVDEILEEIG